MHIMQSAFKDLKLIFKEYLRHIEEQNSNQRRVRQVQQYCEMSFSEPVDQVRARSLRGNLDESALKVNVQKYVKQEWNAVFPIVTQLRFQSVALSNDVHNKGGIRNIMAQIKNIHLGVLKSLTLSHCHIQSIESLHLMNLNALKQLDLSHNAITSLKSLRKITSPGLEQLNVSDNCLVSLQYIEEIKLSKNMKQIIIQDNLQEASSGQSINCLWKIQPKSIRIIRFKFSIQDSNHRPALMPCTPAVTKNKGSGLQDSETQKQFFNDYFKTRKSDNLILILISSMQASYEAITHKLPLDQEGYVQSFNIDDFDPEALGNFYNRFGFVIFDNVLNQQEIELSIDDLWQDVLDRHDGDVVRNDPSTWNFIGPLGRFGFVGDQPSNRPQLWKNRSNPKVYKGFKRLYEISAQETINQPLFAMFDRGSILRPSKLNPDWRTGSIYHFDIHPWWWTKVVQISDYIWRRENYYDQRFPNWLGEGNYVPKVKNFTRLQGVLALSNTGSGTGGFECVCGFQNYIDEWCQKNNEGTRITRSTELMQNMQQCYQRAGSLLIFSRELPHNIYPNDSQNFRYAQYMRMAPESTLMLTAEEKEVRRREVKKMLPSYYDVSSDICQEIYMLQDEQKTTEKQINIGKAFRCEMI